LLAILQLRTVVFEDLQLDSEGVILFPGRVELSLVRFEEIELLLVVVVGLLRIGDLQLFDLLILRAGEDLQFFDRTLQEKNIADLLDLCQLLAEVRILPSQFLQLLAQLQPLHLQLHLSLAQLQRHLLGVRQVNRQGLVALPERLFVRPASGEGLAKGLHQYFDLVGVGEVLLNLLLLDQGETGRFLPTRLLRHLSRPFLFCPHFLGRRSLRCRGLPFFMLLLLLLPVVGLHDLLGLFDCVGEVSVGEVGVGRTAGGCGLYLDLFLIG
jgi:hypothetical protein